jgi:2-dehydropantoate 2-reductase
MKQSHSLSTEKKTRILIIGVGALGGTIAARALNAELSVFMAARDEPVARSLRFSGLEVSGLRESITVPAFQLATVERYQTAEKFDLILLAIKAQDALGMSSRLLDLLRPGGVILSIQNGCVPLMLADQLGCETVLGGISNLAATMVEPGRFEQRNSGNLILGEINGGLSERAIQIEQILGKALKIRVTPNLRGAIWAKLLINCSVTTIGAITGQTMREYIRSSNGKEVFCRVYQVTLAVALASGTRPERMIVEPIPPRWSKEEVLASALDGWLNEMVATYGNAKASMLQDLERGRRTEIDFINGYVAKLARKFGLPTPMNSAITSLVHQLEQKRTRPHPQQLERLLAKAAYRSGSFSRLCWPTGFAADRPQAASGKLSSSSRLRWRREIAAEEQKAMSGRTSASSVEPLSSSSKPVGRSVGVLECRSIAPRAHGTRVAGGDAHWGSSCRAGGLGSSVKLQIELGR